MSKPVCRHCGESVLHGNLFCSAECGKQKRMQRESSAAALLDAGFVQNATVPNVYERDGISITLEHIDDVGMDAVMAQHEAAAAAIRAHGLGVRADAGVASEQSPAV